MSENLEPALVELARAHGVATSYQDWAHRTVAVGREAVLAALAALDVDASSDAAVRVALQEVAVRPWRRLLPPSLVLRSEGELEVRAPAGERVELVVVLEDGGAQPLRVTGDGQAGPAGRVLHRVRVAGLPLGWHTVTARAGAETDRAVLVVAPRSLALPPGRTWGWMVQLYAMRSATSWGVGEYADLRRVVEATTAQGGGALLLNPLHAETPLPPVNPSPYSPSSRRFRSLVPLTVQDVPELALAPLEVQERVRALRPPTDPQRVLRDPALSAKTAALELLWPYARQDALAAHRAERGQALEDFALFCALAERHGLPWRDWPEGLRRPDGAGVAAARAQLAERVAFWCWTQLLVDEQLAAVSQAAQGMAVGVVHDLAVGVDADGADAWALQDALALGTTVGAPPDSFNQQGQDWGLPPWRPDRLRDSGYAPYRSLLQGVLRSAGGLRIDHVMGLFRLWWVPPGASAALGTYVAYDAEALLGVLALEAVRAGAVVVGEDLGTVEDRVEVELARTGVMGSAVLWFQRDQAGGAFQDPASWREDALATVTTHDLPTAAGLLAEEQVRVRDELGQLGVPVEQERERVRDEREQLLAMLTRTGLLQRCGGDVPLAMHAALAASPCRLVLAAFGDAVGDLRQPNLPGTVDQYPNWRLPVADGSGRVLGLEELLAHPGVARLSALLREGVADVRYRRTADTPTTSSREP